MAAAWESRQGQALTLLSTAALGEKRVTGRSRGGVLRITSAAPGFGAFAGLGPGQWRGSNGGMVEMHVGEDGTEVVDIDPEMGPKIMAVDGSNEWMPEIENGKSWRMRDSSDQKILAFRVARMNADTKRRLPELKRQAEEKAKAEAAAAAKRRLVKLREDLNKKLLQGSSSEIIQARCLVEMNREAIPWTPIGMDLVISSHKRRAPGMMYGLEFPWSAETLMEFGPAWLTKAFQTVGTLADNNRVTSITIGRKIDAGNNAGKFLFEVAYEKLTADLDTELFAKVPYEMTKATQSDRISSSVYKQPMDQVEINTYRLLEAGFPVLTPKFYFGDISNETSNFILITRRIPFAEVDGVGEGYLEPLVVEGPYDKCMDFQLRGSAKDYYMLLMSKAAKIAAHHQAGKLVSDEVLSKCLLPPRPLDNLELWGMNPSGASGMETKRLSSVLKAAVRFFSEVAAPLFPAYAAQEAYKDKWFKTMMTWSAYQTEIEYWKHSDPDYVALGHNNLNQDNAYFWRDQGGKLDCGLIDWGGFGVGPLGHKMWWSFNCADFDNFGASLDEYIDTFIATYREHGGPLLDKKLFEKHVLITSLANQGFMAQAVPNCFKMCPLEEWKTIKDRRDPRISKNIDGKSTLRTTIHVLGCCIRALEELGSDKVLEGFIRDIYVGKWGQKRKTEAMIFGT